MSVVSRGFMNTLFRLPPSKGLLAAAGIIALTTVAAIALGNSLMLFVGLAVSVTTWARLTI
jgi:hypothetical protein